MLAIDVGTYLTLAFRLGDEAGFHAAFGAALGAALQDLGVSARRQLLSRTADLIVAAHVSIEQTRKEVAAVQRLPLTCLVDASLRDALNTVDFVSGIELTYHAGLRAVQRRLNDFPHQLPLDFVPEAAIRRLFGVAGSSHVQ